MLRHLAFGGAVSRKPWTGGGSDNEEAAEARRKLPETLRGINEDDWDNMDWADGIKPGEAVTVMGESGLNRVWNAPDLGFRPVMTNRPKGVLLQGALWWERRGSGWRRQEEGRWAQ